MFVVRRVARVQQVVAEVVADAPVQVLARSVDAGKRLLVQQARQPVLRRHPLQRLHRHHLMIGGDVGALEDRRDFVLPRRHLVVPRLDRHADLVELGFGFGHAREHALGDRAEVLILELLTLRRTRAEQRPAGVDADRDARSRSCESIRKYSCSGPQVAVTRVAVEPNSLSTRTACADSASIERRSGVFLSSASPVQLTNAVGMTSVTLLPLSSSQGGLVGSHAV